MTCASSALVPRYHTALVHPPYPPGKLAQPRATNQPPGAAVRRPLKKAATLPHPAPLRTHQRMSLAINDIVPEALHRRVGWDMRHHFMAEKIVARFGLQLPRDRELVRQLAVVYVLSGLKAPP